MSKENFIAVDSGTQSLRAILFDTSGREVLQSKVRLNIHSPRNGWTEQDADEWWSALCKALRDISCQAAPGDLAGLGITYQRETFVILDKSGNPIRRAILWNDQRAASEITQMEKDLGKKFFHETTGKFLDTTPSAVKIKWIANNEPENFKKIDKLIDVGTYLQWKLTGELASPLAGADTLGILDIRTKNWSPDLLYYLNLTLHNMSGLVPPGYKIGAVTEEAAASTGLPAGLPVIAAGGDGQVSAIGSYSIDSKNMALTLGTSLVWGIHSKNCVNSPYYRTMIGCLPDNYYFESVLRSGSTTVKWFVDAIVKSACDKGENLTGSCEQYFDSVCEAIKPGCDGLLTIPYWKGGMMPYNDPLARGMTVGWSDYHTKDHFYRSILEGTAFELRLVIEGYMETLHIYPEVIRVGGGGAASSLWCRIISDVTGIGVTVNGNIECTALGAAMITSWGLGYFKSLEDASRSMYEPGQNFSVNTGNNSIYSELYSSFYKKLYPAVRDYLNNLGKLVLQQP